MKAFTAVLMSFFILQGCNKEFSTDANIENPTKESDCEGDIICSLVFKTVQIQLQKSNGEPANVQEFRVFFTETGEELENLSNRDLLSDLSQFEIANDAMMDEIDFEGTSITLEATISKFKTWKGEFIIAKDCCHVFSPEGQKLKFTL